MEKNEQMRGIPSVDKILHAPALSDYRECDRALALAAARAELDALRRELAAGRTDIPSLETLAAQTRRRIERMNAPHLTRVINATGVVLHTNLGRACLSERAAEHVYEIARGYSNTEYNLASGCRGSRYSHVDALLCELTGAESAPASAVRLFPRASLQRDWLGDIRRVYRRDPYSGVHRAGGHGIRDTLPFRFQHG